MDLFGPARGAECAAVGGNAMRVRVWLVALVAALVAACSLSAARADAATPTIENGANILEQTVYGGENNNKSPGPDANRIWVTLVVSHDPGAAFQGIRIDDDFDGTDNTASKGLITSGVNVTSMDTSGPQSGGLEYDRITYNYEGAECCVGGTTRHASSKPFRVRARYGGADTATVSKNINVVAPGGFSAWEDYPYLWGQSQTTSSTTPGGTVSFTFTGDDGDGSGDEDWGGVLIRLRRASNGTINSNPAVSGGTVSRNVTVNGSTGTRACFGASDNTARTATVTLPDRGRWIVEANALNNNGSCGTNPQPGDWFHLGAVDVNTATAPTGSLSVPARVAYNSASAGTASISSLADAPADQADGGVVQYVQWDADGNTTNGSGGFEATQLGNPLGAGVTSDSQAINTTGLAEGTTFAVRTTISDNSALVAYDGSTQRRTYSSNTTVNTRPVATSQAVDVQANSSSNPITLAGTDANGDSLTYTTVGNPSKGTLSGSGANRTYTPNPGATGTDSFTFRVNDGFNDSATTATVTINIKPVTTIDSGPSGTVGPGSQSFTFSSQPGVNFECKLDAATYAACTSPQTYTGLADGPHTFSVRGVSGSVTGDEVSRTFTVDATPPETTIDSGPEDASVQAAGRAMFAFSSSETGSTFECRLDGGSWDGCSSPEELRHLSAGPHTFEVRATDAYGNTDASPASRTFVVLPDVIAPTTSDDVPAGWQTDDVTVTLTADDSGGSGVDATYYEVGTDPAEPTSSSPVYDPAHKPTLGNGERIKYFSVDEAGNAETAKTSPAAQVDKQAPVTTDDVPAAWQNGDVTVTLTADDAGGSGVDATYYEVGTDPADPTTGSPTYDPANKPVLHDGELIKYFSVDAVGNTEAIKTSPAAKVDEQPPTTTDDVPTDQQNGDVTVTLTATDAGSGIAQTYYETGTDPADPTTGSPTYDPANKPVLHDGEKIKYFSVDNVGNTETVKTSSAVRVDPDAPVTTDDVPAGWQKDDVTVTLTATDAGVGVDETYYETGTDPADPTTGSPTYDPANKPVLHDGEKIKYFSTDLAGNAESVKTSPAVQVDKQAPATTDDVPAGWQADDVTVTLSASDTGGSDVDKTYYTVGANPADPDTSSDVYDPANKPVLGDGESIKYFSVDVAGNEEAVKTSPAAQVDKQAPTTTDDVPAAWQKDDVTVTLSADDYGSGVDATYFTVGVDPADPDTSSDVYDPANKPVLGDGERIKYFSVDQLGNAESVKTSPAAKVDKEAPSTTDDVPAGWQKDDVAVTLTASDTGGSGVAATYYETGIDPIDPTTGSPVYDPASKPVLGDGERIKYFSIDAAGNEEAVKTSPAAQVDKQAPTTTDDVPASWQSDDVTVTLSASDTGGSGLEETYYTVGANPAAPDTSSDVYDPANKPVLHDGERIRYFSTDVAGNAEAVKTSPAAQVDKQAPTTTDDVPTTWQKDDVAVTLTATDSGSGVDAVYYETGTAPDEPNLGSPVYDPAHKPVLGDGEKIRYFAVDEVGNAGSVKTSPAAKVDKQSPTTTDDVPAAWQKQDVAVTLSASDTGGSGVDATYYEVGTDPDDPTTGSSVFDPAHEPTLGNGEKIKYFTVDTAGNAEPVKTSPAAKVDEQAPTTTDDVPVTWQKDDVTVTLTAADTGGSGLEKTYYTVGVSPADPDTSSDAYDPANKPVLGDGERIKYFSVDVAGNAEPVKTSPAAKVDKQAPTTGDDVPAGGWNRSDVTVTLTAADTGGSGVDATYYEVGTDPDDPTTGSSVYDPANKPVLGDGERIKYFSVDVAGNAEAVKTSPAVQVDQAAPATSDDVPAGWQTDDVTVTLTAIDSGGSGVDATYYETGTDPDDPTTGSSVYDPANKPVLHDGEKIKYFSVDVAGNPEAVKTSGAVQVDKQDPATSDDVPAAWQKDDVTVTLAATDDRSGVDATYYETGTSPDDPTTGSAVYDPANKPVLGDGEKIKYFSVDVAGNSEAVKTSPPAKVDKQVPATTDGVPATGRSRT
jgi:hypothetical protein